ncbi:hypothetical protein [Streptosporangium sp. NPDC051022]|uniref:hypothetical protein n=1 Tax=Streptosporangium sp. NPDC051022 TaxID=3155752 RepID=UPI00342E06A8
MDQTTLTSAEEIFTRRVRPARGLAGDAGQVAEACRAMAARFHGGGRLTVFGDGETATGARHIFERPGRLGPRVVA